MATTSKANKPRTSSMLTRNGRTRLKPLNLNQLTDLMEKTASKKSKAKIRNRIKTIAARTAA